MHDPVAEEERADKREAEWRAKWDKEGNRRKFVDACEKGIREIAFGHNDPMTLARSILASEFGTKT